MTEAGVATGLLLLIGVVALIAGAPSAGDWLLSAARLGRGPRRWAVLALAVALPLWVGVVASLSTPVSRPFAVLLVVAVGVPLLLACAWAWARARSLS